MEEALSNLEGEEAREEFEEITEPEEEKLTFEDIVSFTMLMESAITFVSILIFMSMFIYSVW
ncbi:hypothetical protein DRQ09_05585 [candidate division KSB1 bacterium]|nr:MAG: hypothetical protein DRQ09_05585 [candidate division KSB1 bacterium]